MTSSGPFESQPSYQGTSPPGSGSKSMSSRKAALRREQRVVAGFLLGMLFDREDGSDLFFAAALPHGKDIRDICYELGGLQTWFGRSGNISCPVSGLEPRPSSPSLYRLNCPFSLFSFNWSETFSLRP